MTAQKSFTLNAISYKDALASISKAESKAPCCNCSMIAIGSSDHVYKAIDSLPVTAHPMTQFATGVMALQVQSEFQKAYDKGIPKSKFWEPTCEDSLNLIAQVPIVASYVYQRIYKGGDIIPSDGSLDYVANFSYMLGLDSPKIQERMRLYVTIHSNHEGGDVSAHTARLVSHMEFDEFVNCLTLHIISHSMLILVLLRLLILSYILVV